jgi:8-oxo-dGTP diphosphatase
MPRTPEINHAKPDSGRDCFRVVAGILADDAGRVLLAERTGDHALAGLWEFPGGKIGAGETSEAALVRELTEEIGVRVDPGKPCLQIDYAYPDRQVRIEFFLIRRWRGTPAGLEGQALRWLLPRDIDVRELLPANAAVLDWLRANPVG